jgi:RNA polymerase sigma factor (sigma-70 family)
MAKALASAPSAATPAALARRKEDDHLAQAIERERGRLQRFIRRRVADLDDADDILQDVLYELVRAERLVAPIEQVGAWLARVARNRIIDRFRADRFRGRKAQRSTADVAAASEEGEMLLVGDLLPSPDAGPEAVYAHGVLMDEIEAALDELPAEQREVFVAHEVEGRSFKELAEETGLSVNTLIGRKHYAVRRLRKRLQAIYNEFT